MIEYKVKTDEQKEMEADVIVARIIQEMLADPS